VTRRELINLALRSAFSAGSLWPLLPARSQSQTPGSTQSQPVEEVLSGDPGAPAEVLTFDSSFVDNLIRATRGRGPNKDPRKFSFGMLAAAQTYVGVGRTSSPDQVQQFLQLFGLDLRYANGSFVPYCAAGLSFCACKAYCQTKPSQSINQIDPNRTFRDTIASVDAYYFRPSASCSSIVEDARRRGTWVDRPPSLNSLVKPGWLVFFDWTGAKQPQHVGIVERADGDLVKTVEFNTSTPDVGDDVRANRDGGTVARKERASKYVLGFVRIY